MGLARAAAVYPRLTLSSGGSVQDFFVDHSPFTIGRLEGCDMCVRDPYVSRHHAEILSDNGDYVVVDMGSRHGTFVNGERVERHRLKANDRICLGTSQHEIIFEMGPTGTLQHSANSILAKGASSGTGDSLLTQLEGLSLFLEAARQLNASHVVEDVLATLLETTLRLTNASRAFVFLVGEDEQLRLVSGRDKKGTPLTSDQGISHSVIRDAVASSSKYLIANTSNMADLDCRVSIVSHDLRSIICIPLFRGSWGRKGETADGTEAKKQLQGVLYLDSSAVSGSLNRTSEDVLTAIANDASALLDNARLVEAEQVSRIQKHELQIACAIQQELMQVTVPELTYASIEARSLPCKDVGGDFYDVVQTPTGTALVLVDVSGKGVSSALLASTLQGIICSQLESGAGLTDVAAWVDRFIARKRVGGKYATMILARIEPDGKLEFVNCGHIAGIIARGEATVKLESNNRPVGLLPGSKFASEHVQLVPGDRLVIVSDGITECANGIDEEFGIDRLVEAVRQSCSVNLLFDAMSEFCCGKQLEDDCTALMATFKG